MGIEDRSEALASAGNLPHQGLVPGGTFLTDFLYPEPADRRVAAIIKWWEKRRLPYNLIVGATGLASVGYVSLLAALPPSGALIGLQWIPFAAVYAVLANLCFSLGPTAEIALEKLWGRRLLPAGPLLFRAGITVAVGVTLLPTIVATLIYLVRILSLAF